MEDVSERMMLIAGLGNPGEQYAGTRHNLGFMVVNELSRRWQIEFDKKRFDGRFGMGLMCDKKVALIKPSTFMNRSGQSVLAAVNFYRLEPQDVLVVMDDLSLPAGRVRLRLKGSAGGQKGLGDILNHLGSTEVRRLRIGIGSAPAVMDATDYVLGRFSAEEKPVFDRAIVTAADAIEMVVRDGMLKAMDRYNRVENGDEDNGSDASEE